MASNTNIKFKTSRGLDVNSEDIINVAGIRADDSGTVTIYGGLTTTGTLTLPTDGDVVPNSDGNGEVGQYNLRWGQGHFAQIEVGSLYIHNTASSNALGAVYTDFNPSGSLSLGNTTAQWADLYVVDINASNTLNVNGDIIVSNATPEIYLKEGATSNNYKISVTSGQFKLDRVDQNLANPANVLYTENDGTVVFASDVSISGNLTISGDTLTIDTANLLIDDTILVLNASQSAGSPPPVTTYGVVINRGNQPNVAIQWNESSDIWNLTGDYSIVNITGGGGGYVLAVTNADSTYGDSIIVSGNTVADTVYVGEDVVFSNVTANSGLTWARGASNDVRIFFDETTDDLVKIQYANGTISEITTEQSDNDTTYSISTEAGGDAYSEKIRLTAGGTGSGTDDVTLAVGAVGGVYGLTIAESGDTITFAHADTSSQASVNNSGRTYIQDITLDEYGHITAITSATETVTDTNTTYDMLAVANTEVNKGIVRLDPSSGANDDVYFIGAGIANVSSNSTAVLITANEADTLATVTGRGATTSSAVTFTGTVNLNGTTVINEGSADVDFRVESNGNTHALFVDAGNDRVGLFTSAPSVGFHYTGDEARLESSTSSRPILRIKNTNADANPSSLILQKDSSSPAASDVLGEISFTGDDTGGSESTFATIKTSTSDVTSGSEDGILTFQVAKAGTLTDSLVIRQDAAGNTNVTATKSMTVSAGDNQSANVVLTRADAVGTAGDVIGYVQFQENNASGVNKTFATFLGQIDVATNGSEYGNYQFNAIRNGSSTTVYSYDGSSNLHNFLGSVTGDTLTSDGSLSVATTSTFTGEASFNAGVNLGDNTADLISVNGRIDTNVVPNANSTYDLGITTKRWNNGYFNSTVYATSFSGNLTGDVTGNASTASKWATARTITLGGDLTGSVSIDGSADVTLNATVAANKVALGTDTTGNYVASVSAGAGIDVSGTGEGAAVTVSIESDLRGDVYYIGQDTTDYFYVTTTSHDFYLDSSLEMRLYANGDLHVDGDVIAYSSTISSDAKLKKDVENVKDALNKIEQLNGVEFTWIRDDKRSAGVIAQDVEKVLPQLVSEHTDLNDETNIYKTVDYGGLSSIIIEAIKELKEKVEAIEAKVNGS